ncbi:MAG: class I SAM-dependent methyltransferase [Natronospirillum sp.]|uniref:class I SAM-dependent methyltransferase n=1 Tax=Natronospirillum sp. TaxID=2812955 RepID=UPI0025E744D0|nr:class I SAM-dependent methyltransferase [Natronospirillum sp.]MCH8551817.1 class I SAM-dependent methyltransferase [Natronospirillum sp.]
MQESAAGQEKDRFDHNWLTLREPADHEARASALNQRLVEWLPYNQPLGIVDLGCGQGSNLRYLAPLLPGPQQWTLVDHDEALLAAALQRCAGIRDSDGQTLQVDVRQADLRQLADWSSAIGADTQLVTASALLDLVSADWLSHLVAVLKSRRPAIHMVLSVDGQFGCSTLHADDELIRAAFNAHQRGPGPFGHGLGPDAAAELADRLQAIGYRVQSAASPWHVPTEQAALQRWLIQGWGDAAIEQCPDQADRIKAWTSQRLAEAGSTGFLLTVGHTDVLALPPMSDRDT